MSLKIDALVMCSVKSIEGATVFVDIEGDSKGSIVMSEVAAGRIRNLREYVFPNKKIVCKVLRIAADGHAELTLRRVTGKEREEAQERYRKEKTIVSLITSIVANAPEVIAAIKEKYDLADLIEVIRLEPKKLEEFMKKEDIQRLAMMVAEKEEREKIEKQLFKLKTTASNGISDLKTVLNVPNVEIKYLGSSQFSITARGTDFKETHAKINTALVEIGHRAKEKKAQFEIKEK